MGLPEYIKEILFTLFITFMRFIVIILIAIGLVGCTAAVTAPFTLSIWFIWAIIAALSPAYRSSWAMYSGLISIQLLLTSLVGFLAAIDSNQYPYNTKSAVTFFFVSIFFSGFMWIIASQDSDESSEAFQWVGNIIKWWVIIGGAIILIRIVQLWYQNTYMW